MNLQISRIDAEYQGKSLYKSLCPRTKDAAVGPLAPTRRVLTRC